MKEWLKRTLLSVGAVTMSLTLGAEAACSGGGKKCKHDWSDPVEIIAANCEGDGETLSTCTKCGETKTETVKGGHRYVDNVVNATCKENGYTEHTCSVCNDFYTDSYTMKIDHRYEQEVVTATCLKDGSITYTCAGCGESYYDVTSRAKGHKVSDKAWAFQSKEQDSDEKCLYHYTETAECETCHESVSHVTDVHEHDYSVEITKIATCQQAGEKTYSCKHCSDSYTKNYTDASAHAWEEVSSENGVVTYRCQNAGCQETKTQVTVTSGEKVSAETVKAAKEVAVNNVKMELGKAEVLKNATEVALSAGEAAQEAVEKALESVKDEATKKALEGATVYDFNLVVNGKNESKLNSTITISLPYTLKDGEDPASIAVFYLADDGTIEQKKATYSNGFAIFETDHFSMYSVVRLTAAQRCVVYGHTYETETVEATCTTDGYIFKTCSVCHSEKETTRTVTDKAIGHDYEKNVHAASCTEKGYTQYTCSHCQDTYISDRTAQLAHSYAKTTVAATCTEKGYTQYTCSHCQDTYYDAIVSAKGHSFDKKGKCTVCGAEDPSKVEVTNFYFNFLESFTNLEGALFEIKSLTISQFESEDDGREEMVCELSNVKLQMGKTTNGFTGKGEGKAVYTEKYYDSKGVLRMTSVINGSAKILLQDGKYTMLMSYEQDGARQETLQTADLNVLLEGDNVPAAVKMMLSLFTDDSKVDEMLEQIGVKKILDSIKEVEDSPFNAILAKATEYVFTKTETPTGYRFAINFDRLNEVFQCITDDKLPDLFDKIFGTGKFNELVDWVKSLATKKFSEIEADIVKEALTWGVKADDVYDLIDLVVNSGIFGGSSDNPSDGPNYGESSGVTTPPTMPPEQTDKLFAARNSDSADEEKFSIRDIIAQYKDLTVLDLINAGAADEDKMTAEGFKTKVDDFVKAYREATIWSLIAAATGSEIDSEAIGTQVESLVALLKSNSFTFSTNESGAIQAVSLQLGFETMSEEEFKEASKDDEAIRIAMNGGLNVTMNGSYVANYADVAAKADNAFKNAKPTESTLLETYEGSWGFNKTYFVKDVQDGEEYVFNWYMNIWGTNDFESLGKEKYAGVECDKYRLDLDWSELKKPDKIQAVVVTNDCTGWKHYNVSFASYESAEILVWFNADGMPIGIEIFKTEGSNAGNTRFFRNENTGAIKAYEYDKHGDGLHSYKLIDHKDAVGCEEAGYNKYVCTVCGNIQVSTFVNGHDYEWECRLAEGATSCEEGLLEVGYCATCKKVLHSKEVTFEGDHPGFEHRETLKTGAACGDLTVSYYGCVCGKEEKTDLWIGEKDGNCKFEPTGDELQNGHDLRTYTCYVTHVQNGQPVPCGYSYTVESWDKEVNCTCTEYYKYTFRLADGTRKTYELSHSYESHNTENVSTDENSVKMVCRDCHKTIYEQSVRYDKYNRIVYYYRVKSGKEIKYTQVWSGCSYERTYADGHTESGTEHRWNEVSDTATCTQPGTKTLECEICHTPTSCPSFVLGHNFHWDEEAEIYRCQKCGATSKMDSEYIHIEVLESNSDTITFGVLFTRAYKEEVSADSVHFFANLNYEGLGSSDYESGLLDVPVELKDQNVDGRLSFKVTVSVSDLTNALNEWKSKNPDAGEPTLSIVIEQDEGGHYYQYAVDFELPTK